MEIQISFSCSCGSFVEQSIDASSIAVVEGSFASYDHDTSLWSSIYCEGCSKEFNADIRYDEYENIVVDVDGVYGLSYEVSDMDKYDDLRERILGVNQEIYEKLAKDIVSILKNGNSSEYETTLNNMLYAQAVSALEFYLSNVFISNVIESDDLIRRLIESDPELSKRKFDLGDIFRRTENLKSEVIKYLRDLIFHNIEKIKPMFNKVLEIDFGDVTWLFKAVLIRHDCIHRCGFTKSGMQTTISRKEIEDLIEESASLVCKIEEGILNLKSRY